MKAGQLTRRKGALERLINNLETFKKEKKDKVSIKTGKVIPFNVEVTRMEREIATLKSRINSPVSDK
jgi:SMC interacting uncharacterized protein involved in chromosome segregation|nr:MAG TPA: hypothetical protein [Crassvirales sp.]